MRPLPVHASVDSPKPRRQAAASVQGSAAPRARGRLSAAAGCGEHTVRWSPTVTTTQSTRRSEPWQGIASPEQPREPKQSWRAQAPQAGCGRSRQGPEFAESRFRASRITFLRRRRPCRRSPRLGHGLSLRQAERSSHGPRHTRCSVSSNREEIRVLGRAPAPSMRATAPDRLLTGASQTIDKRLLAVHRAGVVPAFMPKQNSAPVGTMAGRSTTRRVPRLAKTGFPAPRGSSLAFVSRRASRCATGRYAGVGRRFVGSR